MQVPDTIDLSRPVQVYRNLTKPGCQFSVRQDGKVRGYVDNLVLIDVRFKHATAKQLASVRTGARQVCQWLSGRISMDCTTECTTRIACDPKTSDGFLAGGIRIDFATVVTVSSSGCFASL